MVLRLKTQKEEDRDRKSRIIKNKLLRTQVFQKAKIVMCYIAFGGEVKTEEMIKTARRLGKIVAVPVCRKDRITLRPVKLEEDAKLKRGPYGIYEPAAEGYVRLKDLDLVIVPGVAFDKKGNRLGRGKGYYDRFLKRLTKNTFSLGVAFDFQILPYLPTAMHDVSVHNVIFA